MIEPLTTTKLYQCDIQLRSQFSFIEYSQIACEWDLARYVITHQAKYPLLNQFPFLYKWEYAVRNPFNDLGVGDLLFRDKNGRVLVVELKYLNMKSGPTAQTRRRKNRHRVIEQAYFYGRCIQIRYPQLVVKSCAIMNEIFGLRIKQVL